MDEKFSSDALGKVELFPQSVACSGTTWNLSTYHVRFVKDAIEIGCEGSIINLHSQKENASSIHEIDYPL
ncbi:MAG: hypothetical protein HWD61_06275 [Parachlamydiaceae bacterium]|nr:MAG: hypothetical protein HWD61_06275 [Parachlamydiaceae bacterium]